MSGYFTGPPIAWGPSAIEQLSALGLRRAFVVIDPEVRSLPRTRQAIEELTKTGGQVAEASIGPGEPTVAGVEALVEHARAFHPDGLVAIGGGRTIDHAKALSVRLVAPDLPIDRLTPLTEFDRRTALRLIALPTTCGSGSEATWTAELRSEDGAPLDLSSRELTPDWAIVDPTFLVSLPLAVRATSGADAIGHAFEAAISEWSNPFSDALALHALGAAVPAMAHLAKRPEDDEVVARLHWSATQAGLAVANAPAGIGHALARALGAAFDLPHGRLMAALLPYVAEFNYPSARDRYDALAPVFGPSAGQSRSAISEKLRTTFAATALPRTLVEAGVQPERLSIVRDTVVARAVAHPGATANPRVPSAKEVDQLLGAAMTGTPVLF